MFIVYLQMFFAGKQSAGMLSQQSLDSFSFLSPSLAISPWLVFLLDRTPMAQICSVNESLLTHFRHDRHRHAFHSLEEPASARHRHLLKKAGMGSSAAI